jgi:hypothetical protein
VMGKVHLLWSNDGTWRFATILTRCGREIMPSSLTTENVEEVTCARCLAAIKREGDDE